jgi:hypothetical protein
MRRVFFILPKGPIGETVACDKRHPRLARKHGREVRQICAGDSGITMMNNQKKGGNEK